MTNPLETFNRILFLDLRPWMQSDVSEQKYKQDLSERRTAKIQFQPLYEVSFPKALNNRRKYYVRIIENEATNYLNYVHSEIEQSTNSNQKKYVVHMALEKAIKQKLTEIAQVINDHNYQLESFDPKFGALKEDTNFADEAYIIHFLKYELVRIFLEIQNNHHAFVKEEQLLEEDLYLMYFNHVTPKPSYLVDASKITIEKPVLVKKETPIVIFNAVQGDVRDETKKILTFETILKNSNKFKQFEENLFEQGYIDEVYNFTNKHGLKNELAAIYHHLIVKGYFNPRRFEPLKEITTLDIRKFLDYRYACDTDKQFRLHTPDTIQAVIDKYYWLTMIPSC